VRPHAGQKSDEDNQEQAEQERILRQRDTPPVGGESTQSTRSRARCMGFWRHRARLVEDAQDESTASLMALLPALLRLLCVIVIAGRMPRSREGLVHLIVADEVSRGSARSSGGWSSGLIRRTEGLPAQSASVRFIPPASAAFPAFVRLSPATPSASAHVSHKTPHKLRLIHPGNLVSTPVEIAHFHRPKLHSRWETSLRASAPPAPGRGA
jgi:hypothetical protein